MENTLPMDSASTNLTKSASDTCFISDMQCSNTAISPAARCDNSWRCKVACAFCNKLKNRVQAAENLKKLSVKESRKASNLRCSMHGM